MVKFADKIFYVLFICDVAVITLHFVARNWIGFFDLEKEGALNAIYTGVKLWGIGTAAILYGWALVYTRALRARAVLWIGMGILFAYIGIDDMMVIHERIGFVLNNVFGAGGFAGESFNWLWYASPFVAFALFGFVRLIREMRTMSIRASYILLIGALLWVFSLLVEWEGGKLLSLQAQNHALAQFFIVMEESLELIGASLIGWSMALVFAPFARILKNKLT